MIKIKWNYQYSPQQVEIDEIVEKFKYWGITKENYTFKSAVILIMSDNASDVAISKIRLLLNNEKAILTHFR